MKSQIIFLDTSRFLIPESQIGEMQLMFTETLNRIQEAFTNVNVEIVLTKPESGDYSTLYISTDFPVGNGILGLAQQDSLSVRNPNDIGMINFNELQSEFTQRQMTFNERINLFSNSVLHEIGHLMGLEHTDDPGDIMHNGLTDCMWEAQMNFTDEQLMAINSMIDATYFSEDDLNEQIYYNPNSSFSMHHALNSNFGGENIDAYNDFDNNDTGDDIDINYIF